MSAYYTTTALESRLGGSLLLATHGMVFYTNLSSTATQTFWGTMVSVPARR